MHVGEDVLNASSEIAVAGYGLSVTGVVMDRAVVDEVCR